MAKKTTRTRAVDPVALFKVLADHHRYQVIMLLHKNPKGLFVGDLAERVEVNSSAMSHLLALLLGERVVVRVEEGRSVRYILAQTPTSRAITRIVRAP